VWYSVDTSKRGNVYENQAHICDDQQCDANFARCRDLNGTIWLGRARCPARNAEDQADGDEDLKNTKVLRRESWRGLCVDEVDPATISLLSTLSTMYTYRRCSMARVANSSGERPMVSMMMLVLMRPVEWSVRERNWHTAPAMRTTQSRRV
jgi:hypothetical protein